jgi:hypothetical protein
MPASVAQLPREAHMEMVAASALPARPRPAPARATGRQAEDNVTEQAATLVHNMKAADVGPNDRRAARASVPNTARPCRDAGEIWLKGQKCRE